MAVFNMKWDQLMTLFLPTLPKQIKEMVSMLQFLINNNLPFVLEFTGTTVFIKYGDPEKIDRFDLEQLFPEGGDKIG